MRKKFKPDEREAFKPGTPVEWRYGGYWHRGTVRGEIVRIDGWDEVWVENHDKTARISPGQRIDASPTFIRLPVTE